jgi:hypothetical protein
VILEYENELLEKMMMMMLKNQKAVKKYTPCTSTHMHRHMHQTHVVEKEKRVYILCTSTHMHKHMHQTHVFEKAKKCCEVVFSSVND